MPLPPTIGTFDLSYESYWKKRIDEGVFNEPSRRRARGVIPFIVPGETVLDVGCGTGETLKLLREEKDIKGTGLDISETALSSVREKGFDTLKLDLTKDGEALENQYDHIIAFELVEHLVNPEAIMHKLRGKYRKGLYITTPNLGYLAHRLRMAFGRFPVTYIMDPREHLRFWTVKDFKYWARHLGYPCPEVIGLRGKCKLLGVHRKWPSLLSSEVLYRFVPPNVNG
jgi:methionine biosynthesis protein MetW